MTNGRPPVREQQNPAKPKQQTQAPRDTVLLNLVDPQLQLWLGQPDTRGLLDTLIAIGGRPRRIRPLHEGADPYTIAQYTPQDQSIEFALVGGPLATETLAHEFGHMVGLRTPMRLPTVGQGHGRRANERSEEAAAQAFSRAVLALRVLARDTTNAESVITQFEQGLHPSLSSLERFQRRRRSGTERIMAELLGLPIYAKHPMRVRRQEMLNRASTLNPSEVKTR